MERDCMIVQGAAKVLIDRLFKSSDPYAVTICEECGFFANSPTTCHACKSGKVHSVALPYASKLLFSQLSALGIKAQLGIAFMESKRRK